MTKFEHYTEMKTQLEKERKILEAEVKLYGPESSSADSLYVCMDKLAVVSEYLAKHNPL